MWKLRDENDPFVRFISRVVDLCALDLLWVLLCLPVVTAGAATCALHYAIGRMRRDQGGLFRGFFRSFAGNFRQATLVWLLLLAASAGLIVSFSLALQMKGAMGIVLRVVLCVPLVLLLMVAVYAFPLLARFHVTLATLLSDCVLLAVAWFPRTVLLVVILFLPLAAVYFLGSIVSAMFFIWIPIGFSLTALAAQKCLDPIMAQLEQEAGTEGQKP